MTILFTIIIFLEIMQLIIFIDVILSWLTLVWINIRPKFISNIIEPSYKTIRKILPTRIWMVDFTPIVAILLIIFVRWTLFLIFPELQTFSLNLL